MTSVLARERGSPDAPPALRPRRRVPQQALNAAAVAFALGVLLAVPVGFLMGWRRLARGLIEPYVQFFRMIPPLAVIALASVIMGIGELPKVFVIFVAACLSSVVAVHGGMISVDKTLIYAARVLGAGDCTIFRRVVAPASLPFIMVGLRIGLGSSWATVVAAELIAAQSGLGVRMQQGRCRPAGVTMPSCSSRHRGRT